MNEFLKRNYHTHTCRCRHAFGTDVEYIEHAINGGFEVLGFTDHVILPDYVQYGMRGDPEMFDGYIEDLNRLKEQYKDKIKIHLGFECEYMPEYLDYYRYLLDSGKVDYLICGQHCRLIDGTMCYYGNIPGGANGVLETAIDTVKGIETGLFSYVCHPDMFMMWWRKWDDVAIKSARMICEAAAKHHVPLEINGGRHRPDAPLLEYEGKMIFPYPYPPFWEIAKEYGCETIFGIDAHAPSHLDEINYEDMYEMAQKIGLKIVDKLEFKSKKVK